MASLLSVNVGMPKDVEWQGKIEKIQGGLAGYARSSILNRDSLSAVRVYCSLICSTLQH